MFTRLLLLFTIIPLVELYILIKIGSYFGVMTTILLIIGTGVLGAYLARQQGFKVWLNIQNEIGQGKFPADDLLDGLLLLIAGVVLLTPGLLTDLMGFTILFPVTRRSIRLWVKKKLSEMIQNKHVKFAGFIQ